MCRPERVCLLPGSSGFLEGKPLLTLLLAMGKVSLLTRKKIPECIMLW